MTDRVLLAVDGGNSKTDVVLATEHGELLAHIRGAGSSPHHLGLDGCIALLDDLVRSAQVRAGLAGTKLDRGEIYLAGADFPAEVTALHEAVEAAGWAVESVVGNDAFALLRAGTDEPDAAAVVCGAGINCVGRTSGGRSSAFPSLGQITGDWGGGRHLGYEALWHAARAEDGRGAPTDLERRVAEHFGYRGVAEVAEAMHFGDISEDRVIELTPVLFATADSGDSIADGIVDRLAAEMAVLIDVMLDRLELRDVSTAGEIPAVLGGGVVRAQHRMLVPKITARLRLEPPAIRLLAVTSPPVLGAAWCGLDAFTATAPARHRLRLAIDQTMTGTG